MCRLKPCTPKQSEAAKPARSPQRVKLFMPRLTADSLREAEVGLIDSVFAPEPSAGQISLLAARLSFFLIKANMLTPTTLVAAFNFKIMNYGFIPGKQSLPHLCEMNHVLHQTLEAVIKIFSVPVNATARDF